MLVLRGLEGDPVVKVAPLPSAETLYACACTSLNPQGTPLGPGNQLHLCCQSNNRPGVQLCCQPANLLYPVDTSSDSPSSPVTSISIVSDSTRRRRRRPRPPKRSRYRRPFRKPYSFDLSEHPPPPILPRPRRRRQEHHTTLYRASNCTRLNTITIPIPITTTTNTTTFNSTNGIPLFILDSRHIHPLIHWTL